jgi:hypothetical protein
VIAIYLYCIVRRSRKPSLARVPGGLPGASAPDLLRVAGSLWLVYAEVPLQTYGAGNLDRHLSDLEWVGRVAMTHEQVVEYFSQKPSSTVVPMKLFTMFSSRERALEDVGHRRSTILGLMRKISGAQEWGIRVMHQPPTSSSGRPARRARSGAAFLAGKKAARDSAKHARTAAAESALLAFRRLSRLARQSRLRQDFPPSAATTPLVDAAFLVPTAKKGRFTQAARREAAACAKTGAVMTLTGPWPPYNFVHESGKPQ